MENVIMTRWNRLWIAALLGMASGACSERAGTPAPLGPSPLGDEALALRAAPAELDPYTCLGTRCGAGDVTPQAAVYRTRTCEPEAVNDLEVRWQRELPTNCGEIGECSIQSYGGENFVLDANGAIWFAAAVSTPERDGQIDGAFVGSVGADGLSQGGQLVDQETSNIGEAIEYAVSLAKTDGMSATLSISKYILREGQSEPTYERWLTNHELWSLPPSEKTLSVQRPRDVWAMYPQAMRAVPVGAERLLLAPADWPQATLAMIDTENNEPVWVQTREGLAPFDSLTVDGAGRASVLTMGPWDEETMTSTPSIEHYEADGRLAWIRTLPAPWGDGIWSQLSTDPDGNIINVGIEQNLSQDEESSVYVQQLSPDGDTNWVTEIPQTLQDGFGNSVPAAIDKDGNIFVVGPYFYEEPAEPEGDYVSGQLLYELSPDGERCRSHRVLSANVERIAIADNGDIYFFGWNLGRLMRK
jgi:hypothetical protein